MFDLSDCPGTDGHLGTIEFSFGHSNKEYASCHRLDWCAKYRRQISGATGDFQSLGGAQANGGFLSIGDGAMPSYIITLVTPSQPLEIKGRSPMYHQLLPTHCLNTLYWLVSVDKARASLRAQYCLYTFIPGASQSMSHYSNDILR